MSLTDEQRAHLEGRLKEERARALELLRKVDDTHRDETLQERAGDLTLAPTHIADLGTDAIDDDVEEWNAARISRELAEIDAALERLYKTPAAFGISEATGQPIAFERLDLIPWARTGRAEAEGRVG